MTNEQIIWNYFIEPDKIGNPFGVAGLMGNIKAESSFKPTNLNNVANKKLGLTDEEYTAAVDNGSYDNFIKDGYDYGLCQWIFWTRKKKLLELAQNKKKSVGDLQLQIDFIWQELQAYSSVLKVLRNANDVNEAMLVVLTKYEKPADQGEKAQAKRLGFAEEIYNRLFVKAAMEKKAEENEAFRIPDQVKITGDLVNVRYGDSTDYAAIGTLKKGAVYDVAATSSDTGWYAIRVPHYKCDMVLWVSNKYAEPIYNDV